MAPRRHLGGRGLGGRGIGQRSSSAGFSPTTALLAAPATPTLTWVTGPTDNTPQLLLDGDLAELDTVREQHSTDSGFAGSLESTNTVDASEDAANELDFTGIGALADGTWYARMRIERPGHFPSLWSNTETETIDTTAPTLSSPSGTKTGETTAGLSVSTNEGNGVLYVVVTTSATQPSTAQIKAGQNNGGSAAAFNDSQAIASTGTKNFSATGLTGSTQYWAHYVQEDAVGNNSNRSTSSPFTTDAGASTPATWNPSDKTANVDLTSGNLTAAANNSAGGDYVRSTAAAASNQKVYDENAVGQMFSSAIGFSTSATTLSGSLSGAASPSTAFYITPGGTFNCVDSANNGNSAISSYTTGDDIDVAFDTSIGKVWFRRTRSGVTLGWNDQLAGTQNPATGQGGLDVPFAGAYLAILYMDANTGDTVSSRFASASWVRSAPSGFTQLAS